MARDRAVGEHGDPAGPVDLGPRLGGDGLPERCRPDAGRPDDGAGGEPCGGAALGVDLEAAVVDPGHHRSQVHLDPEALEVPAGLVGQPGAELGEHALAGVEQQHPGVPRVDTPEVPMQRPPGQLHDLAGHLHPGGARPHHGEGEPLGPALWVGLQLCGLEGSEDPATQLQRVRRSTSCPAPTG